MSLKHLQIEVDSNQSGIQRYITGLNGQIHIGYLLIDGVYASIESVYGSHDYCVFAQILFDFEATSNCVTILEPIRFD